jgi:hypothetical protein
LKWQILSISGIVVESMGTLPHPDSPERKITYWFADLALIFLGVVTVFAKSYEHLLKAIDSSIYASLSMSATGQGLIPHLPIGLEANGGFYGTHGFNDHPTLLLYLSGWLMRLLGLDRAAPSVSSLRRMRLGSFRPGDSLGFALPRMDRRRRSRAHGELLPKRLGLSA